MEFANEAHGAPPRARRWPSIAAVAFNGVATARQAVEEFGTIRRQQDRLEEAHLRIGLGLAKRVNSLVAELLRLTTQWSSPGAERPPSGGWGAPRATLGLANCDPSDIIFVRALRITEGARAIVQLIHALLALAEQLVATGRCGDGARVAVAAAKVFSDDVDVFFCVDNSFSWFLRCRSRLMHQSFMPIIIIALNSCPSGAHGRATRTLPPPHRAWGPTIFLTVFLDFRPVAGFQ